MGNRYRHIQPKDRLTLYELLFKGYAIADIANTIGFHRSSVYRELNRNSCPSGYRPDWACQQYVARRQRPTKFDHNAELKTWVIEKLKQGWSPDAIAGRLKKHAERCIVSRETLYRYVYSKEGIQLKLYRYLQQKRRFRYPRIKRRKRTIAQSQKRPISERDAKINQRKAFGHWEGDLLLFQHTKTNLFTLRERKSRFVIAIKNQSRKAKSTANTLLKYMRYQLDKTINTLTLDNDTAFALHEHIAQSLKADIYFCEPYKSYQKGAVENANKLIRTKLPKRTKIDKLEQQNIDKITQNFNDRPMRCLGYQTPKEVFLKAFGKRPLLATCRT